MGALGIPWACPLTKAKIIELYPEFLTMGDNNTTKQLRQHKRRRIY
jgi:hypothetical protein